MNLLNPGLGKGFSDMTPTSQAKEGMLDFIKMKNVLEKTIYQGSENAITEFRKMLHSVCLGILDFQRTFRQKIQKSYHPT